MNSLIPVELVVQVGHLRLESLHHLHGVGPRAPEHPEPDGRTAVDSHDKISVLISERHTGDVPDVNRSVPILTDNDVLNL